MDFWGGAVDVGLRVAEQRVRRGWTYRDLEEETGRSGRRVSATILYRIEKGGRDGDPQKVSVDDLVALCRAFGMTPDDLLTRQEVLDKREGDRLTLAVADAVNDFWQAAQRIFSTTAELSWKASSGKDRGVAEFVIRHAQSAGLHPDVHPLLSLLNQPLGQLLTAASRYPDREAIRAAQVQDLESQIQQLEAFRDQYLEGDQPAADRGALQNLLDGIAEERTALQGIRDENARIETWEAQHPIVAEGVEL